MGSNPYFAEIRGARTQLVMQPVDAREVQDASNVRPDIRPGMAMPVGRGVLIADRLPIVLQTTSHEIPDTGITYHAAKPGLTPMPVRQPLFQEQVNPPVPVSEPIRTTEAHAVVPERRQPHRPVSNVPAAPAAPLPVADQAPLNGSAFELVLDTGDRVSLQTRLVVGRRPGDDGSARSLTLPDATISARHLVIESLEGTPYATDQGSRNGTVVCSTGGTTRLEPGVPHALATGDEIRIGSMSLLVLADQPALG